MARLLPLVWSGVDAAARHRLRTLAASASLAAVLTPFAAGLGIAEGIERDARTSIDAGADVHVTGERFGRPVPLPAAAADAIRAIPGVTDAVPRVVASIRLGLRREPAILVGLPEERLRAFADAGLVEGRLPRAGATNELAIGAQIAERLGLRVGSAIPPFYRNAQGERISMVVGVFRSDLPLWEANLVLAEIGTAARICDARGIVSGLLVSCAPEYADAVRDRIASLEDLAPGDPQGPIRPRAVTRGEALALVPEGVLRREGVFDLHFVLAFAMSIPLLLVTSGVGLAERRRETGLLKALGWHTDEVIVRGVAESFVLALLGASAAALLAWAWVVLLGGAGIAGVFLDGLDASPGVRIPYEPAPVPLLLAFVLSVVVASAGTLLSTWRAASAAPMEAMR